MSGDWRSRVVTRSVREGLLWPAFWALSVRMAISALGSMALYLGVSGMLFCGDRGSCGTSGGGGVGLRVRPTCVGVMLSDVGK